MRSTPARVARSGSRSRTTPKVRGEMTITISLADADGGTDVLAVHDGATARPADRRQRGRLALFTRETRGARRGKQGGGIMTRRWFVAAAVVVGILSIS